MTNFCASRGRRRRDSKGTHGSSLACDCSPTWHLPELGAHEQSPNQHLHDLVLLVACRGPKLQKSLLRSRCRWPYLKDLARIVQFIAWTHRMRGPEFLKTHAD